MFDEYCRGRHKHHGLIGLTVLSAVMTLPLIYYAMDIAHSLRQLAGDKHGDEI